MTLFLEALRMRITFTEEKKKTKDVLSDNKMHHIINHVIIR